MLPTSAPIDSPDRVIDAFVDAWNQHDMAAFDLLFTDDASWTTTFDARIDGRDDAAVEERDRETRHEGEDPVLLANLAVGAVLDEFSVRAHVVLIRCGNELGFAPHAALVIRETAGDAAQPSVNGGLTR